ncbi:MFS general substrate transporter [Rhizopogon salebrosus TDB-379]|nr:MFS general substrate transporter [Rhizopogon salebrosus TDB-379]
MVSEERPLLASTRNGVAHESIYDRFTSDQKRWIVFVVSFVGLLPAFVHATFVPSIPQIAKDLDSTHAAVSFSVSLSIFAEAIGALVWAAYSSFYGRRLIYLYGILVSCIGSCGVAMSTSLRSLLFWRFVQSFGCSGGLSLGAGAIGDIYEPEERGTRIGIFYGATLLGFVIAPFLGGAAAKYWSWRYLHYSLGAWGLIAMLLIHVSFQDTNHPGTMGIDKVARRRRFHIAWVNPLGSLWLLRSPNLFAMMLASSLMTFSGFVLLVPIAYTLGVRYGITNEAVIGACFLPNGLGNIIGTLVAGHISDIVVKKWRVRHEGVWYPEDRLRTAWIGGLFMVPLSVGASGLLITYAGDLIGLLLNLLCIFLNGMGVDLVLNSIAVYNLDVVQSRNTEIMAAYAAARSLITSVGTALIIPSIERIGVAGTDIVAAILALVGQGIIFLTIRYGDRMRASVNVGFSTAYTN